MIFLALIASVTLPAVVQSECSMPPPAANFNASMYYGTWYEVGKIQTKGGGYFEKDCVCTSIDIEPAKTADAKPGDATAINSCRKLTPTGDWLNATGQLTDMSPPGKWKEGFFSWVPKVDYTVIYIDQDIAVEYDCSVLAGLVTNYCIHIMARTPTPNATQVEAVKAKVDAMKLNQYNLPYLVTKQDKCWSQYY